MLLKSLNCLMKELQHFLITFSSNFYISLKSVKMLTTNVLKDLIYLKIILMGFRPSVRTSNNIFVLKTLIDKQFHKNKKNYIPVVWKQGLIAKLNYFGIEGKMLHVIKDIYSGTNGHATVGEFMSDNFKMSLGIKQGDPPNPFFFNLYG